MACAVQRGLFTSSHYKVIPRTSIRRRVYSTTLLLLYYAQRGAGKQNYWNNMNKYIEEYISRRKKEIEKLEQIEQAGLLNKLQIGEREYRDDYPDEPYDNFPFFDSSLQKRYRLNVGEISKEDYIELLKYVPKREKTVSKTVQLKSRWYIFAIVITIIAAIVMLIGLSDDSGVVFIIGASVFGYMLFFMLPIICLLVDIEYNQRTR